jgi:hypothetical protein
MSRTFVAASVVLSLLSSVALADELYVPPATAPHFAQPPGESPPAPWVVMPPRTLDRDTVRAALIVHRDANLAAFRAYQSAGVFPSNTYQDRKLNVWRDDAGHLCAAATIINASGATALVGRVAEQSNFIKLGEVTTGPLMDWILTSGFTQDEIAMIQEPYMPVTRRPAPHRIEQPLPIQADLRTVETARLAKLYKQIDAKLVAARTASLDLAVTRLMKKPALAWQLVDAAGPSRAPAS